VCNFSDLLANLPVSNLDGKPFENDNDQQQREFDQGVSENEANKHTSITNLAKESPPTSFFNREC